LRLAVVTLFGATAFVASAAARPAGPDPQEELPRRANPAGVPRGPTGKALGRAGLTGEDVKKNVMQAAPAKAVQSQQGAQGGSAGGESGSTTTVGGGKPKSGAAGGGSATGEGAWDGVQPPNELDVGIEYKKPKAGTRFSFNLVDADLIELIKIIGNITGKSFILGGKVPNIKATIYAPTKITAEEAYQAFLSVLQVNGLTVMPAGRYLKVVSVGGSTSQNTPIVQAVPGGDQIVTRLHRLQHVPADEMAQVLDRFKSSEGDVAVYNPTNTLIITDYGAAIRRLLKLVAALDVEGIGEQIWIEPVNYADATALAERILEIFDVSGGATKGKSEAKKPARQPAAKGAKPAAAGQPAGSYGEESDQVRITRILADTRTNSLIIVASETSYLRILELMKRLDVPIAGEGTLHVHKLQHADAEELAKTLNALSRTANTQARAGGKKGAEGGEQGLFEGQLEIAADKATNSLVIVSSLRDYMSLKSVITLLDTMKRQVFVEAVIMEVSLDKNRNLAFGFHVGSTFDIDGEQSLLYGSSQPSSDVSSLVISPGALSGLAAGLRGPELPGSEDIIGISIPAFGVAMQALQTNSDANVLSTPHILATDNVEASITVGENVPIQQGFNPAGAFLSQAARTAGGSAGATGTALGALGAMSGMGGMGYSIGRQNVGLTLKLTPYINDDDQVRLEIDLEISEVKSVDSSLGPNISKQNAKTTSVVADQQTIIIGGLITDNQVETTQKVPVLGDIPIIGVLFRSKKSLTKKRNLLIFLTPYIIRSADDFREIFRRKMAERREFIERYTAFEFHRYDPHLDWSRTNGAVAVVNEVVTRAQSDEEMRRLSEIVNEIAHEPKQAIEFPRGVVFGGAGAEGDEGGAPMTVGEPVQVLAPPPAEER
jgi:general secretion pathway protein D